MWLTAVEAAMQGALRAAAKQGVREYAALARPAWVLSYPAQLVIVVSNLYWGQVRGRGKGMLAGWLAG
jgi:hypothetical protein